jgi:hypothetical protein
LYSSEKKVVRSYLEIHLFLLGSICPIFEYVWRIRLNVGVDLPVLASRFFESSEKKSLVLTTGKSKAVSASLSEEP